MTQIKTDEAFPTVTFTVADPRTFDGDPYEVAERACRQAAGIAAILEKLLDGTDKMARNAEMERAFANHQDPQGSEWPTSPLGRAMIDVRESVTSVRRKLGFLATASGYNPRKPPKA